MVEELDAWYHYAASADGFIGGALKVQRAKAFQFEEQQRVLLGIQGEQYNDLWVRLQAMPLPRADQCAADLALIVAKVQGDLGMVVDLNLQRFEALIRAGLE